MDDKKIAKRQEFVAEKRQALEEWDFESDPNRYRLRNTRILLLLDATQIYLIRLKAQETRDLSEKLGLELEEIEERERISKEKDKEKEAFRSRIAENESEFFD